MKNNYGKTLIAVIYLTSFAVSFVFAQDISKLVPKDTGIVELILPEGSTVKIDDIEYETQRLKRILPISQSRYIVRSLKRTD